MKDVTLSQQELEEVTRRDQEESHNNLTFEEQEHTPPPLPLCPHLMNPTVDYLPPSDVDGGNLLAYIIHNEVMINHDDYLGTVQALGQETGRQIAELTKLVQSMAGLLHNATNEILHLKRPTSPPAPH